MECFPTIGLEVHAELKTRTKMFCGCLNNPEEKRPNVHICPVCLGFPGTLPVINKEAIKHILRIGEALEGTLADLTEFDRKHYFYPDIPKGYQISQYKYPLVSGGTLYDVALTRVHLEEDTARSSHDKGDYSLVDFNRSGLPLMELVTEPVIHSAKEAADFARELRLLLRTLGVSDANMEKGEMRVEANVSVSPFRSDKKNASLPLKLGTKVEVKNLNSFRIVEKAIEYEISRQTKALGLGEKIMQETRGWDEARQRTFSQRSKEDAHDYRYFPDPDLPKLELSEAAEFQSILLPELPGEKRERYKSYGIKGEDIEMYAGDFRLGEFFDSVMKELPKERLPLASNYITSDLAGLAQGGPLEISAKDFAALINMLAEKKISSRGAKDILAEMFANGGSPGKIAEERNLFQKSDEGELIKIVRTIIFDNKDAAAAYASGKESSLQFFIGQGMKETRGSANPEVLKRILMEELKK